MTFAARGMDSLAQDLKYAVRSLRKAPGFTIVAALALALGIGANTVLFSVISFALLRPVPFPDPDRLVIINQTALTFANSSCSWLNYVDWKAQGGRAVHALRRRAPRQLQPDGRRRRARAGPRAHGDFRAVAAARREARAGPALRP